MITYKKMSIFDAPKYTSILHACNSEGKWDTGVAAQIKEKYPEVFEDAISHLKYYNTGFNISYTNDGYAFINLITSSKNSQEPDCPFVILINTCIGLTHLLVTDQTPCNYLDRSTIYMPKINSGGFKVPWIDTERVLQKIVDRFGTNIVICDPNMKEEEIK